LDRLEAAELGLDDEAIGQRTLSLRRRAPREERERAEREQEEVAAGAGQASSK
jgi:hypothetical protein